MKKISYCWGFPFRLLVQYRIKIYSLRNIEKAEQFQNVRVSATPEVGVVGINDPLSTGIGGGRAKSIYTQKRNSRG